MKAIICTGYGSADVLKLEEVPKPVPKSKELLIKVRATTVTAGDIRVRTFHCPVLLWLPMRLVLGITKPRKPILGVEMAGEIEAVGTKVTRFQKGDRVYALNGMRFGAHAEYACMPEDGLVALQPNNATSEETAAILFGGTTALHFLRKGNIRSGQQVLVYGASGAVGTSAVQLAKHFGAKVTGVCSAANAEWVKALGADRVMDYTKENGWETNERYDIVFDAVGKTTKARCREMLKPNGTFLTVEGQGIAKVRNEDLLVLKELVEAGELKAVIDRIYPLEQVPEAHRYVEKGHKKGNVVITVSGGS